MMSFYLSIILIMMCGMNTFVGITYLFQDRQYLWSGVYFMLGGGTLALGLHFLFPFLKYTHC
ncbi:TPA: hypothetical protein RNX13_002611 [Pasteurella multocida]|uniref:hypothetical protein n=1 Tax=Pasteurella multocida TaxID=747 RepID=UPI000A6A22B5|nr:hypothetical protein [Pasteurella multocida]UWZ95051.1 hypothetical protein A0R66_009410 [Pasteurella multocida subsp. multocida]HDX0980419.1 hypothetical protein [Pasteurella multocida]HDX1017808.1 hypothetical protein [Pasteurella multocida]HDX1018592.1 hypothetical protein [Pasteurella multocida]HDX1097016.1 hypothetical protein [Pasteurella multocida]